MGISRQSRVVPVLAALIPFLASSPLSAATDDIRVRDFSLVEVHGPIEEGSVRIKGFSLVPMAYHDGQVKLHPKALIGAGYDSNVYATSKDQVGDGFYQGVAGIEGHYEIADNQRVATDMEVEGRAYGKQSNRQQLIGRVYGQYDIEQSNAIMYQLSGGYVRMDDPLIESGQQIDRGQTTAGGQVSYDGLASRLTFRLDYEKETFYQGGSFFLPHERDTNGYRATALYGYRKGDFSEFIVRVSADELDYVREGRYQDSIGASALLGWRGLVTPHIGLIIGGGLQGREFADDFNHDQAYGDQRIISPIGIVAAHWDFEDLSRLGLRVFSEVQPSAVANTEKIYGADLGLRYRVLENAALLGGLLAYRQVDSGAPTGQEIESRNTVQARGGVEYYLREGVGVRVIGSYDVSRSRLYNDFERLTVRMDFGIAY